MLKLLRKLFSTRDGARTVVIVNDDGTKPSSSYRLNPIKLWLTFIGIIAAVIIAVILLLRFTPMGKLVYNQNEIRKSVIAIQQKVAALQDTIEARNVQLNKMQNIIRIGKDTTLMSSGVSSQNVDTSQAGIGAQPIPMQEFQVQRLPANTVLISKLFEEAPEFPTSYPVDGTLTRRFNIESGHYGIDIAASRKATFRVIADGVIINQEWTFNYGYVLMVQHSGGIISLYKHARTVNKATGETVQKGAILGTIGDVGILSSGPHLHLEIWKRGIPQNPLNYLVK